MRRAGMMLAVLAAAAVLGGCQIGETLGDLRGEIAQTREAIEANKAAAMDPAQVQVLSTLDALLVSSDKLAEATGEVVESVKQVGGDALTLTDAAVEYGPIGALIAAVGVWQRRVGQKVGQGAKA